MTPRVRRVYTDEHRARACELYRDHGQSEAARLLSRELGFNIHKRTLDRWVKKAGAVTTAEDRMAAAHKAETARRETQRDTLKAKLLDAAVVFVDRAVDVATVSVTEHPIGVDARATAAQRLMVAAGIAIDKLRLEGGEVTAREEVRHDLSDRSTADLISEAESILREASKEG